MSSKVLKYHSLKFGQERHWVLFEQGRFVIVERGSVVDFEEVALLQP